MKLTSRELRDGVAIVRLDHPPVNALDTATLIELDAALAAALADPGTQAVVLTGSSRAFSAGADLRDAAGFAADRATNLAAIIERIEVASKPVIAAIDGACLGGGFELALGCHFRVAARGAKLGLPEVLLGLVPGAGGTQRLPRAIGLEAALPLILKGDSLSAQSAANLGVVELANADLIETACLLARLAAGRGERPRLRDKSVALAPGASVHAVIESARSALRRPAPASLAILECLEAAVTLPFDEGLEFERRSAQCILADSESRALRYAFVSERTAAHIPGLPPSTVPRPISRLAVVGAGTMGRGITMSAVNAGLAVTLIDQSAAAVETGIARIVEDYAASLKKGRLESTEVDRRLALITPASELAAARDADLVIEAVFEDLRVKEDVFRRLDAIARPDALFASNTSTLDVNRMAQFTQRPGEFLGLHFFSPANVMRLLEIVRGRETSLETLASALAFAKRIGKVGVVAGVCDGFIGNRLFEEYLRQAYYLLEEGALPWEVDRALEAWGMAMGPFAVMDLAGGDIGWAIRKRRAIEDPDRPYSRIPDLLCERGRFGQKTGAGYYRYDGATRRREPDPEVESLILEQRRALGIEPRAINDEEMVSRCVYALANEGARALEDGVAYRASDIDVVYLNGYGFPRYRGGPMWYADECGLSNVLATMARLQRGIHGECWTPAPLLLDHVARGARLTGA